MKSLYEKIGERYVKISFLSLLLMVGYISSYSKQTDINTPKQIHHQGKTSVIFKVIQSKDNTWGYDIYLNGKPTIHQPTIPAIAGNKGFSTKKQAASVAKLVVHKVKEGQMPPSVTIAELKTLKAI